MNTKGWLGADIARNVNISFFLWLYILEQGLFKFRSCTVKSQLRGIISFSLGFFFFFFFYFFHVHIIFLHVALIFICNIDIFMNAYEKYILTFWSKLLCATLQDDSWEGLHTQHIIKIENLVSINIFYFGILKRVEVDFSRTSCGEISSFC